MHIVLALILVALLFALTDPFMYWMPPAAVTMALVAAVGLVAVFAGFVVRENGGDERERLNRSYAGRVGYLAGLAILTLALIIQGLAHELDPWIPISLGAMIAGKVAAHWYADRYR